MIFEFPVIGTGKTSIEIGVTDLATDLVSFVL